MARQIVVIALIFFAIVGMATASAKAPTASVEAPAASPSAEGPAIFDDEFDNDLIGTTDGESPEVAPVGGPVPDGVFPVIDTPAPSPKSGAAVLEVTGVAGLIAAASASFFF